MPTTNENVSKGLDILKQIIKGGLGGIIALAGILILVIPHHLGYEFPGQIAAGIPLVAIGAGTYITVYIINVKSNKKVSTCVNLENK